MLQVPVTVGPLGPFKSIRAREPRSSGNNVALHHLNVGTECFESAKMEVDRAMPDVAASRKRNTRGPPPRQQRAQDTDAGPHSPHEVVMSRHQRWVGGRCDVNDIARLLNAAPQRREEFAHRGDIGQIGNVLEGDVGIGRERGGQYGQSGILRAADHHGSAEKFPTLDDKSIHAQIRPFNGSIVSKKRDCGRSVG